MKPLAQHPYNRSNLFLVRVWSISNDGESDDNDKIEWGGKIQRVVNGEAHQFTSLQGLMELLEAMASNDNDSKQQ